MNGPAHAAAPIRAAVIGVGSFGRHHARIYDELRPAGVELVGLVDIDDRGPRPLADRLGVPLVRSAEQLPQPVDVVSVATPTSRRRPSIRTVSGPPLSPEQIPRPGDAAHSWFLAKPRMREGRTQL